MSTEQTKLAYPIEEAFAVIGVNRSAGYKLIAEGKLKTFKVGKRRNATRKACERCVNLLAKDAA